MMVVVMKGRLSRHSRQQRQIQPGIRKARVTVESRLASVVMRVRSNPRWRRKTGKRGRLVEAMSGNKIR